MEQIRYVSNFFLDNKIESLDPKSLEFPFLKDEISDSSIEHLKNKGIPQVFHKLNYLYGYQLRGNFDSIYKDELFLESLVPFESVPKCPYCNTALRKNSNSNLYSCKKYDCTFVLSGFSFKKNNEIHKISDITFSNFLEKKETDVSSLSSDWDYMDDIHNCCNEYYLGTSDSEDCNNSIDDNHSIPKEEGRFNPIEYMNGFNPIETVNRFNPITKV